MSLIFGALAAYGGWKYVVSPGIETAEDLFEDFMQQYDVERKARTAAGEAVGDVGGLVPGPLGPLFRFLGIYIRGN